jgi:uncharacterized cofD-like protein
VELGARVGGRNLRGQVAVGQTTAPIQAVFLTPPDPVAHPDAVNAILEADQIVLGPGSLFTSLIATVLVPGIRVAVQETKARRVYVCNARMQKGETEGLDAASHLGAFLAHSGPFSVDVAVIQDPVLDDDGVAADDDALGYAGIEIVKADVAEPDGAHHSERLGGVLKSLV